MRCIGLTLTCGALLASTARADLIAVLPRSAAPGDEVVFGRLARALAGPGRRVLGPAETLEALYGEGPLEQLRRARLRQVHELVARGEAELQQLHLFAALSAFSEVRGLSRLVGARIEGGELLPRIHFLAGLVLERKGEATLASAEFRRAVALNPDFVPSPSLFPPEILRSFDRERGAVRSGRRCPLRVVVSAPGATVRLDGRPQGAAPLELRLAPGEHYLLIEAAGHAPAERTVEGCPGGGLEIALAPRPALARPAELSSPEQLEAARAALGASALVLLRRGVEGIRYEVCRAGASCETGTLRATGAEARVDAQPIRAELVPRVPPSRRAWYQSWWFWTGVGVVATAAAISLPLGLRESSAGSPPPPGPSGSMRYVIKDQP